jgi:hypothetical protein
MDKMIYERLPYSESVVKQLRIKSKGEVEIHRFGGTVLRIGLVKSTISEDMLDNEGHLVCGADAISTFGVLFLGRLQPIRIICYPNSPYWYDESDFSDFIQENSWSCYDGTTNLILALTNPGDRLYGVIQATTIGRGKHPKKTYTLSIENLDFHPPS